VGPIRRAGQDGGVLGATYPASGVGASRALVAEAVVTFLLVGVVVTVATDPKIPGGTAAMAIGFALAAAVWLQQRVRRPVRPHTGTEPELS
jgi:glycerol uptake facilitator-like aquaporin